MPSYYPYKMLPVAQLKVCLDHAKAQLKAATKRGESEIGDIWKAQVNLITEELKVRESEVGKSRVGNAAKDAREIFDSSFNEIAKGFGKSYLSMMAVSATTPPKLQDLFGELEKVAYDPEYHTYRYKEANQVIRKYFTMLIDPRT